MPLSTSDKTNELAEATLAKMHDIMGRNSGFRVNHAKGKLVSGTFTPTVEAKQLSKAPHFNANTVPVTVRLSSSGGVPHIPDTDPNGDPRGFAIRFHLGERKHTDIVSHATPFFPVRTGADFLALFEAIGSGTMPNFLATRPAALAFVQAPKPTPKSFFNEHYFGINAFKLISSEGKETNIRYRITPDAGVQTYSPEEAKEKPETFLYDDMVEKLKSTPQSFTLLAQIAGAGDPTDDATVQWPEDREQIKLGTITITEVVADDAELQRTLIFDPVPRVDGVEASDDPILDFRASVYLLSGRERRAAGGYHPEKLPKLG